MGGKRRTRSQAVYDLKKRRTLTDFQAVGGIWSKEINKLEESSTKCNNMRRQNDAKMQQDMSICRTCTCLCGRRAGIE